MKRFAPYLAAIGLAGMLAACGKSAPPAETVSPITAVQAPVAAVEKRSVQAPYEAVGTVRAKVSSTIQSKMMGHVLAVNVKEGDRVEAGQLLVEIDKREAEAQVKRAESALQEAQQAQQETENVIQAALRSKDAAEANRSLAVSTYDRYKGLADSQAISRQIFDEADAKRKGASAEAARAAEMVQSSQAKRGEAHARAEQAKAELTTVQTLLSYAQVAAPFAGIITRKTVEVGDLAAPGTPLLVLEDQQQYRLEAQVDEEHVHSIAVGAKTVVIVDALRKGGVPSISDPSCSQVQLGNKELENKQTCFPLDGTVSEIVPSADPASRTFIVKIDLPQLPAIRSGMFGRARFEVGQRQTFVIPETAIFHRGQLTGVYVVNSDSIAHLRFITIGKRYGSAIEVLSGLEPGERIVLDKLDQVADGNKIQ